MTFFFSNCYEFLLGGKKLTNKIHKNLNHTNKNDFIVYQGRI